MLDRIEKYWQGEANRYNENIWAEMNSFKKQAWQQLIAEYMPRRGSLQVLDIGTGPGFFAMILAEMGHKVTAIDCAENMLARAKKNAEITGLQVAFYKMDSHKMAFPDASFDLLVSRNLTWTLHDPGKAYREWHRVLKPGGRVLIFDANWNLRLHDAKMQEMYEEDLKRAKELGIQIHEHEDPEECDRIAKELFFSRQVRPQWDSKELLEIGFRRLWVDTDISAMVWSEGEKILYRSTPMFLICAEK